MKYTKLILSDKLLTRSDFINQSDKLFVLADNIPDYRLPRHQLHKTFNRGGIAAAMRPNKIGGTQNNPIYDVYVVGIPSLSFVAGEELDIITINDAFANIYRVLGHDQSKQFGKNQFKELVVPYKNDEPAIGGGIAGELPKPIKNKIADEFVRLEKFINKTTPLSKLPLIFQNAYNTGVNTPPLKDENTPYFQYAMVGVGLLGALASPVLAAMVGLSTAALAGLSLCLVAIAAGSLIYNAKPAKSKSEFKPSLPNPVEPDEDDASNPAKPILLAKKRAKATGKKVKFNSDAVVRTSMTGKDGHRKFKHRTVKTRK